MAAPLQIQGAMELPVLHPGIPETATAVSAGRTAIITQVITGLPQAATAGRHQAATTGPLQGQAQVTTGHLQEPTTGLHPGQGRVPVTGRPLLPDQGLPPATVAEVPQAVVQDLQEGVQADQEVPDVQEAISR